MEIIKLSTRVKSELIFGWKIFSITAWTVLQSWFIPFGIGEQISIVFLHNEMTVQGRAIEGITAI